MKYLLLVLSFISLGCGSAQDQSSGSAEVSYIDPQFQTYVDFFNEQAFIRDQTDLINKPLKIITYDEAGTTPEDNEIGHCSHQSGLATIYIDQRYWYGANENQRLILILHEMGHCVLNRTHVTTIIPSENNRPESILYPMTHPVAYRFDAYREAYLDEYFDLSRRTPQVLFY